MNVDKIDVTKYKRLFTFGCSFTNYIWPTWADIIGREIPFYENWGHGGFGIQYIMSSVIECDLKHKFTDTDLVMIMWTVPGRHDIYAFNKWNGFTPDQFESGIGKEWTQKFGFETKGVLIRDYTFIDATQHFLNSKSCDWINMSGLRLLLFNHSKIEKELKHLTDEDRYKLVQQGKIDYQYQRQGCSINNEFIHYNDVVNTYNRIFKTIPMSMMDEIPEIDPAFTPREKRPNFGDYHPTPSEALRYIVNTFPNNIDYKSAKDYCDKWEKIIRASTEKNKMSSTVDRNLPTRI
jgi:hypothetical protein